MTHTKKYTYDEVKEISEQYNTLSEFTKNHVGAYEAALHNGWLKSFTHLKRKRTHTVDSILNECRKFNCYKDFIRSDNSVYMTFLNFYNAGKIKDCDLPWKTEKRKGEWTYDNCYEEAKKYNSRFHFKQGCRSAYNKAYKEKWLYDYTWFEERKSQYTYEVCKELASKYNSRADFQRNCSGAYSQAARNGWLDDFVFNACKIKWNKDLILEECIKYKTKTNLFNNNRFAYYVYLRYKKKGLITDDEINWDIRIKKQGDESEYIHSVYVYDFGNNVAYIGRTMDPIKRDKRHRKPQHAHGRIIIGCVLKHSTESGIEIPEMKLLETDLNMQESCRQEDFWINEYKNRGYTMLNTGVTGEFVGSVGGFKSKWTKEKVIEYARQFNSLAELDKNNNYVYKLLKKFNLLDELFPNRLRSHKITFDETKGVASNYPTRTRFSKGSPKYYYQAYKNGWLDLLFPKKD